MYSQQFSKKCNIRHKNNGYYKNWSPVPVIPPVSVPFVIIVLLKIEDCVNKYCNNLVKFKVFITF